LAPWRWISARSEYDKGRGLGASGAWSGGQEVERQFMAGLEWEGVIDDLPVGVADSDGVGASVKERDIRLQACLFSPQR
jgi:hypothetical protein